MLIKRWFRKSRLNTDDECQQLFLEFHKEINKPFGKALVDFINNSKTKELKYLYLKCKDFKFSIISPTEKLQLGHYLNSIEQNKTLNAKDKKDYQILLTKYNDDGIREPERVITLLNAEITSRLQYSVIIFTFIPAILLFIATCITILNNISSNVTLINAVERQINNLKEIQINLKDVKDHQVKNDKEIQRLNIKLKNK